MNEESNRTKTVKAIIDGVLEPLVAIEVTSAIYAARLLHSQKGSLLSEKEITSEVMELFTQTLTLMKKITPKGTIEIRYVVDAGSNGDRQIRT
jgi:hypothetical protein